MYNSLCELTLTKFPARRTLQEKKKFRRYVKKHFCQKVGYDDKTFSDEVNTNIIIGDFEKAKIVICAHYDTAQLSYTAAFIAKLSGKNIHFKANKNSKNEIRGINNSANDNSSGVIMAMLFALTNSDICALLFDNEENHRLGSRLFATMFNGAENKKLFFNLDTIGDTRLLLFESHNINKWHMLFRNACKNVKKDGTLPVSRNLFLLAPTDTYNLKKYRVIGLSRSVPSLIIPIVPRMHTDYDTRIRFDRMSYVYDIVNQIIILLEKSSKYEK